MVNLVNLMGFRITVETNVVISIWDLLDEANWGGPTPYKCGRYQSVVWGPGLDKKDKEAAEHHHLFVCFLIAAARWPVTSDSPAPPGFPVLPTLVHCTSCEPDKATFLGVAFRCVFIITMRKVANVGVFASRDYNTTNWAEEQTSNAQYENASSQIPAALRLKWM